MTGNGVGKNTKAQPEVRNMPRKVNLSTTMPAPNGAGTIETVVSQTKRRSVNDLREIFVNRSHVLEPGAFDEAVNLCAETNQPLEPHLIEKAFLSTGQFLKLCSDYYDVPATVLAIGEINRGALQFMPRKSAEQALAIPFDFDNKTLKVAVAHPQDKHALDDLANTGKREIKLYVSTEHAIKQALILYDANVKEVLDDINRHVTADNSLSDSLSTDKLAMSVLETAVLLGASDVHLEPFKDGALLRLRIDGLLKHVVTLPSENYRSLVAFYKIKANLRIDQHRLPQDGRIGLNVKDQEINVRISIVPSLWGEKIVMRILPRDTNLLDISSLGFHDRDIEIIRRNIRRPFGMVLTSGPTGSGKTTTLYALLQEIGMDKTGVLNISTIEDPVEYTIPRVTQIQARPEIDLTFANGLRALLRQDPDILMVGEIRDEDTADIAIRSALVGRLLISSIHTNDAVSVIPRLLDMNVEPYLVASTLSLVIAQRLARKLCTFCRQNYKVDAHAIKQLDEGHRLTDSLNRLKKQGYISDASLDSMCLYRSVGCDKCNHSGYSGRIGLYELLEVDDEFRKYISTDTDTSLLHKAAASTGMKTMFEDGLLKLSLGIIDIKELMRVVYI